MQRSDNTFSKNRAASFIPVSTNVMARTSKSLGSNSFSKNRDVSFLALSTNALARYARSLGSNDFKRNRTEFFIALSQNGWDGDNLSGGEYGLDNLDFGVPYGDLEYGGNKHFKRLDP